MRIFGVLKKLLVLVLIGVLCCMVYFYRKQENKISSAEKMAEKYNILLKQIREERASLVEEYNLLHESLTIPDKGSTIVLLSDTHIEHIDDALSIMETKGFHGVVALSPYKLPENNVEGYFNKDQIDELASKNFEFVITINNEDIKKTYDSFIEKGYDIKGFYFENTKVSKVKIETIRKINPELIIIGNYEDGLYYDDYLLIHSCGSKQSGAKTTYKDSVGVSKTIALTVGYDNSNSKYTYDNFVAMLELINEYENKDATAACNISEAKARYQNYLISLNEEKADIINRINEINARLIDIDKALLETGK